MPRVMDVTKKKKKLILNEQSDIETIEKHETSKIDNSLPKETDKENILENIHHQTNGHLSENKKRKKKKKRRTKRNKTAPSPEGDDSDTGIVMKPIAWRTPPPSLNGLPGSRRKLEPIRLPLHNNLNEVTSCSKSTERMTKDETHLIHSQRDSEHSTTDEGDSEQPKHSLKSFLMNSEISDNEDEKQSSRKKAHSEAIISQKDDACSEKCHEPMSGSSVEVLLRIFPQHNPSILEMILKAYDNDLVRATESLMLENGMLRFPTPPISPEESSPPSVIDPEDTPNDPRRSAFSPVSSKIVPYSPHMLPVTLPPSTIPSFAPPGFATRSIFPPYMLPRHHHMGLPFHPYMRHHPGGSAVHSSSTHDSRRCSRCANWILTTDRFCSHCGKSA